MKNHATTGKVAIIGAGNVGSTTAYALMLNGAVSEIALIDAQKEKAEGEVFDLSDCMQFVPHVTKLVAGSSYELVQGADVVIIAAGSRQKSGESRTDLLETNVKVFKEIIPAIVSYNKDCILLVVTNPLDVLTYVAWKLSNFSSCRVFGTGTVLDTARLRYLLGNRFQVSPKDIVAYVLGEHGDSEFVWWSRANIAGIPLDRFTGYTPQLCNEIAEATKSVAYEIIAKKGATFYAIALSITKIVRSIILNQPRVFTVSSVMHEAYDVGDVCLSLPTIIRRSGICESLAIDLNEQEQTMLQQSSQKIYQGIQKALSLL